MDLHSFFNPSSIAIIGVSHEPQKVGYLVLKNILHQGYKGDLYCVNPKGGHILGQKVYEQFSEIPRPVETVVLAIPGVPSLQVIDELGKAGVKNIVLFAAGFKEVGGEGITYEEQLVSLCKTYGITLLGPNCIGFISTPSLINATFLKHDSPLGNIGFLSQSGALGSVMVDYFAAHETLGFSYFVSLGNKAVLDECDVLEFLTNDPDTKVIGMYIEDVKDGERFKTVLQKATKKKPVIILKSGTTTEGSKAAFSHTGGMVGDDQVYDSIFKQHGAIRANGMEEFLILLKIASFGRIPQSQSILVLSNAGGVGVLLADDIISEKMSLETISEKLKKDLQEKEGSKKITLHNPIDLLGDANAVDYQNAIETTISEKDIGCIMILLTPQANTQILETAQIIAEYQEHIARPLYPIFMGEESIEEAHSYFENRKIASFTTYDGLCRALKKLVFYNQYRDSKDELHSTRLFSLGVLSKELDIQNILTEAKGRPYLSFMDSLTVIEHAGISVAQPVLVHSVEEANSMALKLKYPVVAKVASSEITHKTEVKGVLLGLSSPEQVSAAYNTLSSIEGAQGVYLQEELKGTELFLGAKRDARFGTVLVIGVGGIYAELFKDVSERIYPFSQSECLRMLSETKVGTLLAGFRGGPIVKPLQVYSILMGLGALMDKFSEIKEVDINPLMITEKGLTAVDARIILA